jgi:hypothetical protein
MLPVSRDRVLKTWRKITAHVRLGRRLLRMISTGGPTLYYSGRKRIAGFPLVASTWLADGRQIGYLPVSLIAMTLSGVLVQRHHSLQRDLFLDVDSKLVTRSSSLG